MELHLQFCHSCAKSGVRGQGGGRQEETEVSGGVPAEEAFYGHCKQRAGHTAALQLFTEKRGQEVCRLRDNKTCDRHRKSSVRV